MTKTQATATGNEAKLGNLNPHKFELWKPILAFTLFTFAISLAGSFVFQSYKESIKSDKQNELGGIAELKTGQITNWMAGLKGEAQALKGDFLFVDAVDRWLQQGSHDGIAKKKLEERLISLQQSNDALGYSTISLFDDKATLRLSSSADEAPTQGMDKARMLENMRSGQIVFSDIHREKLRSGEQIEIELSAPLTLVEHGKVRTIGVILFRINPYYFLFPLIQRWPTPSASAETLLVRREGDEVVFLNELRLSQNSPLTTRFPLNRSHLPAVMAVTGWEGLTEGIDYRGVPVVCVLGKVPGTPWFMVSKIDKAEIYVSINHFANWMLLLILSLIGVGGGIVIYWRNKEKIQYENELHYQKLAKRLDSLSKYSNDIILLLDDSGKIVDFNDRALEAYGYSAHELSNLEINDLMAFDVMPLIAENIRKIDEAGASRFESMHVRSNRDAFPVESSVRVVNIDGERLYQAIIRDITERRKAEEELTQQKNFIRQVIDSDPNLIFVKDADGKFLLANAAMVKIYGQTTESIIGKYYWELTDNQEQITEYDNASREVIERRQERVGIEISTSSDGKRHIFHTTRKLLIQDDGAQSMLTIATDITELKEAEEGLRRLNRSLKLLGECNAAMVRIKAETLLLTEICKLAVETGGYRMAWVGFAEPGMNRPVHPAARYGHDECYLDSVAIRWEDTEQGRGPTFTAIKTGKMQVNQDTQTNFLMAPWRDEALAHGYMSSIALPLKGDGGFFGALTIYATEVDAFNPDEIKLLEELANNLAYGIRALRTTAERKLAGAQLESERTRLRTLVQTIPDLVWLKSPDGIFLSCNAQFERYFGAKEEDIVGKTDYDFVDAELADFSRQKDMDAMAAGKPRVNEEWITYSDNGQRALLETIKVPMRDEAGKLIGVMGIARDITERKNTEEELRFKNTLLTTEHEVSIDGILVVDENGQIISYNRRFVEIWGIMEEIIMSGSDERAIQSALDKLSDPEQFIERIQNLYEHRDETSRDEFELRDGRVLERYTAPMFGPQKEYYGRIWYFRDITEQKLAAKNLAKSYAQLQRLSMHLENVRADERAKIALNLHDEMGATLAALKMRVAWLASKLPAELSHLSAEAGHISELVSGGIHTLRQIVSQLRPDLMSEVGFAETISKYVKQFQSHTNIECILDLPVEDLALNADQSLTVFRILQESLNNVVKHAQASRVNILFTVRTESLLMEVVDNGVGFDTSNKSKEQSIGLLGIRERALMVGGKARINSMPGKGTHVSVSVPYSHISA